MTNPDYTSRLHCLRRKRATQQIHHVPEKILAHSQQWALIQVDAYNEEILTRRQRLLLPANQEVQS